MDRCNQELAEAAEVALAASCRDHDGTWELRVRVVPGRQRDGGPAANRS